MTTQPDPWLKIAESLDLCGKGLHRIADALNRLGNGNAATQVGAIEGHAMALREALQSAAETVSLAMRQDHD